VDLDPLVVVFVRSLFVLLLMLPWIVRNRATAMRTQRLSMQCFRAAFSMAGFILLVIALANLTLAEVSALTFAAPLFATIGAVLFLHEVVRARRWIATFIGLAGVWIVLRPGFAVVDPLFALPVAAAVFIAASNLMIKSLSRSDSPSAIVAWLAIFSVPLTLIPALFVWSWPDSAALGWCFLLGLAGLGAHMSLTRSLAAADASAVLPYDYARLVVTASIAFVAFGEVPPVWTWIGGAVIVGAVVYIAHREAAAARAVKTEPDLFSGQP
jgi:S-adenosylmethionine uptake transporter